jgi:uncharacterized paraquat-inducible protein A
MFFLKLHTFIKSLIWHVQRGLPKSTQDQINTRFSICETCEDFNAKNNQCNVCGCNVNKKRIFLNKLAWADQQCPKNKWRSLI